MFNTESRIQSFYKERSNDLKDDQKSRKLVYEQRSEAIKNLRMMERKDLRELERSLHKKQRDKETMR